MCIAVDSLDKLPTIAKVRIDMFVCVLLKFVNKVHDGLICSENKAVCIE